MKPGEYSNHPPSYAECVQSPVKTARSLTDNGSGTDLVYSLLTNYLLPHLETAMSSGTTSTTLVLIPSNTTSLWLPTDLDSKTSTKGFLGEKLVGFPSTEELKLIRLSNPADTFEFWQKQASKHSLANSLHAYLVQEGYYLTQDIARPESFENPTGVPSNVRQSWMTVDEPRLRHREAIINLSMQEVCLRIEDEMGLYDTRKGKALVVGIKLGCGDASLTCT